MQSLKGALGMVSTTVARARGPGATPEDEARFKLLKATYVDARYSMKYRISREDLEILAGHVRELRARTERACREHIALLAAAAATPGQS